MTRLCACGTWRSARFHFAFIRARGMLARTPCANHPRKSDATVHTSAGSRAPRRSGSAVSVATTTRPRCARSRARSWRVSTASGSPSPDATARCPTPAARARVRASPARRTRSSAVAAAECTAAARRDRRLLRAERGPSRRCAGGRSPTHREPHITRARRSRPREPDGTVLPIPRPHARPLGVRKVAKPPRGEGAIRCRGDEHALSRRERRGVGRCRPALARFDGHAFRAFEESCALGGEGHEGDAADDACAREGNGLGGAAVVRTLREYLLDREHFGGNGG